MTDLRYALRGLLRAPGFALAAVLTLALGIGATTAIFSVADAVLLRPLPYPDSSRLVMVWEQLVKIGVDRRAMSGETYDEYRSHHEVFEAASAFEPLDRNFAGKAGTERASTMGVSPGFLEMLGASPVLGRRFADGDKGDVALLSHALFVREFGADASALGKSIHLDDRAYTILGVMPPDFDFSLRSGGIDIWTPLRPSPGLQRPYVRMLARLRPGVSIEAAQAAMTAANAHLEETQHPYRGPNGEDPGFGVRVVSLHEQLLGDFRFASLILLCAVATVLLISCVNVANLLLVRAVAREKEIAVKRALGATDARLIRQWMTEAGVLALLGGTAGSVAAVWGLRALTLLSPAALPAVARIGVDWRALAFTLAISGMVCVLFGLAPSVAVPRFHWGLRGTRPRRRAASALVTVEAALALMLLVGAGLLLKSYARLSHVDPGFNPEHLLTMQIQFPPTRPLSRVRIAAFLAEVRSRVAALPGVSSAAIVSRLPVLGGGANTRGGNPFSIEGRAWNPNGAVRQIAHTQSADPEYFRTMQIPLLAGRWFAAADSADAPPVAIVNETLARGFFHGADAIGHQIMLGAPHGGEPWLTIVGIVGDVKTAALDQDALPQFYRPIAQDVSTSPAVVIRTANEPMSVALSAAQAVHQLDSEMPVYDLSAMEDRIARTIGQPRFEALLTGFFAATALFLAAIGIFGVVAHSTAQRTQEIGIRMALGADDRRVLREVIAGGLRPVLIGIALGLAGAFALGRTLSSFLFNVTPSDPAIFTTAAVILTLVAIAACLIPARRATQIDPMAALRSE